ncbi:hypothetical protein ONA91_32405 [Micromonospora sp. DR5-3]|uniref:hypothetical protein n=1 Tax=unclassified Micromonospora TaxID=2617518 RepID=UPI0011D6DF5E|nr:MULTISPECIES: hypothetical protein [unclassified Micromonospora]MCW3819153.1 hypothetical protein [Micromonospora sp. DR5-3]TYC21100.1 hypothetical protein FXF52_27905 [Micromonospora sp. MP36]
MAVLVDVDPEQLVVRLTGADRLWALTAGVRVPTAAITGVRPVSRAEAYARGSGWRLPGTFWPGLIMAGSYVSRTNGRSFWCVHRAEEVLLVELDGEPYDRLVLEVEQPAEVSRAIARARFR